MEGSCLSIGAQCERPRVASGRARRGGADQGRKSAYTGFNYQRAAEVLDPNVATNSINITECRVLVVGGLTKGHRGE